MGMILFFKSDPGSKCSCGADSDFTLQNGTNLCMECATKVLMAPREVLEDIKKAFDNPESIITEIKRQQNWRLN